MLITLDVMMPQMDGWAVLSALKADPTLADIPVIMLTIVDDKNLGYLLGAADYLTKPLDRDRLAALLKNYRPERTACSVLLVEDDHLTRHMLRRLLAKQGWAVVEAENGQAALACVAERPPELIILDLLMPTMDGFTFIAELRKHEDWRAIPIIVITAKDLSPQDRQKLSGSVEKILLKGAYSREALLSEVRSLLVRCARRRAGGEANLRRETSPAKENNAENLGDRG
jgi:CheY-like chemotaxis protein